MRLSLCVFVLIFGVGVLGILAAVGSYTDIRVTPAPNTSAPLLVTPPATWAPAAINVNN